MWPGRAGGKRRARAIAPSVSGGGTELLGKSSRPTRQFWICSSGFSTGNGGPPSVSRRSGSGGIQTLTVGPTARRCARHSDRAHQRDQEMPHLNLVASVSWRVTTFREVFCGFCWPPDQHELIVARQRVAVETCGRGFGVVPMRLVASTLSVCKEGTPSASRLSGWGDAAPSPEVRRFEGGAATRAVSTA